jgi:hypothetical protein
VHVSDRATFLKKIGDLQVLHPAPACQRPHSWTYP